MSFASKVRRAFNRKSQRNATRRARRQEKVVRRRVLEVLEDRQMLDAASLYETLPSTITLADSNSYHYAIEGTNPEFINTSSIEGLTASFPTGSQVSFTINKASADGAVSTLGDVVIQLFGAEGEAPNSSNHFLELVYDDYYDGLTIHRIVPNFVFQGGSSDGYGYEGSGMTIADEYSDVLTHSRRGVVAYANSNNATYERYNTSDAQFYVTFVPYPSLDGGYNVFGYVVEGYDVIDELEAAETTSNDRPVDTYYFSNVHVVDADDQTQSVLRLVAEDNASGVTTIAYTATDAEGEEQFYTSTIFAGQDGLQAYVQDALDNVNFEIVAGETIDVNLPTTFGDYTILYAVAPQTTPARYEIVSNNQTNSSFSINTELASSQFFTFNVTATLSNGLTVTLPQQVFISPTAPTFVLESSDVVKVAKIDDQWFVNSNLEENPLNIVVYAYDVDETIVFDNSLIVKIDDVEYTTTVTSRQYDTQTGLSTYSLAVELDDGESLANGEHTISVQQSTPVDRVTTHERLYSDVTSATFTVDAQALALVDAPTSLLTYVGVDGSQQFATNKVDENGAQRSDIVFSLANPDDAPSFLSLSEAGLLSWSDVVAANAGSYEITVLATDAFGATVQAPLTFVVAGAPVFSDLDVVEAATGDLYEATVVATDSADSTIPMVYALVGDDYPEAFTLDSNTGAISWVIPDDYIDTTVKTQSFSFTVKATEQVEQEDGTFIDGLSASKTFTITITNAQYDETVDTAPIWYDVVDQTVTSGETFEMTVTAEPYESTTIEYSFDGDVPEGMTINASTGRITWNSPSDYFGNTETHSETVNIKLKATTIISQDGSTINYGQSATIDFDLQILNAQYEDLAPVFTSVDPILVSTGDSLEQTIVATDPNNEATRIVYALDGEYPDGLAIDATSGNLAWSIPQDYLATNVSAQALKVKVVATEQYLDNDEYVDGKNSTLEVDVMIANAAYNAEVAVSPTFSETADQESTAGETLTFTVTATLPQDATDLGVEYALITSNVDGLVVDSATGEVTWEIPADFAGTDSQVEFVTREIEIQARTVVSSDDVSTNYGGSATQKISVVVKNPNYQAEEEPSSEYASWKEWFNDWIDLAQDRYDKHNANLSTYLSAYLTAADARATGIAQAKADYLAGKSNQTELKENLDTIQSTFEEATNQARQELAENDAKVEEEYNSSVVKMNEALENLGQSTTIPTDASEQTSAAVKNVVKQTKEAQTGSAKFRLSNRSTGASVATNLTDVLKIWRSGYSNTTAYEEAFADTNFTANFGNTTASDNTSTQDNTSNTDDSANGDSTSDSSDAGNAASSDSSNSDDANSGASTGDDSSTTSDSSDDSSANSGDASSSEEDSSNNSVVSSALLDVLEEYELLTEL
ncbi:MAG: peptidylprolyl isomerase [Planctomycetia bacterium]|nr:peptidylprolyl isomerase [Planctomycetia bacterium]